MSGKGSTGLEWSAAEWSGAEQSEVDWSRVECLGSVAERS